MPGFKEESLGVVHISSFTYLCGHSKCLVARFICFFLSNSTFSSFRPSGLPLKSGIYSVLIRVLVMVEIGILGHGMISEQAIHQLSNKCQAFRTCHLMIQGLIVALICKASLIYMLVLMKMKGHKPFNSSSGKKN